MCGVHHRAIHDGRLIATGRFSNGFRFRHADGTSYGTAVSPQACEAQEKAFLGLRSLGFRETETRRALETAVVHTGAEVTTGTLLRKALGVLTHGLGR